MNEENREDQCGWRVLGKKIKSLRDELKPNLFTLSTELKCGFVLSGAGMESCLCVI